MKKLALTIAIVLGLGLAASAQGGLFKYGAEDELFMYRDGNPLFPEHNAYGNQDAGEDVPLAGGALLLIGFGAAYALKKRNEK